MRRNRYLFLGLLGVAFSGLLALSVACAGAEPTSTSVPPAAPAPAVAPTVAPAPTATLVPGVPGIPTAVLATPAPTRVLPTSTPVVSEKPVYGGTLRVPITFSYDNMDPAFNNLSGFVPSLYIIYNSLVVLTPQGTIAPDLARSWEFSSDGKSITFRLQQRVKFHDGTTADAQAVKWNYDRYLDPKVASARRPELSPPLEGVDVIDDSTVRFRLSYPYRPILAVLADRAGLIASPTGVQKANSYAERNGEFGRRPVGSGPFKLREWIPESHVAVVRNDDYWEQGLPYLEAMRFPMVPDYEVQFAMLRTGELDFMAGLPPSKVAIAKENPKIRVVEQPGITLYMIWFRVSLQPWNNKALRAAFAYALDRETIGKVLFQGMATPAHSPIGPGYGEWYDPSVKVYDYNVQKAKEKLREAGHPDGLSYKQPCRAVGLDAQLCEAFQAMLAKVGINAEIQPYDFTTYWSDFVARKQNGPLFSSYFPRGDPHIMVHRFFHSKGTANTTGYSNPEVDRLIEEASGIYDVTKARQVYNKVLALIEEEAPQVFIVFQSALYAHRDNVRGFAPVLDRFERLRYIWLPR